MDDDETAFFSRPKKVAITVTTKKRSFHDTEVADGSDTATDSDSSSISSVSRQVTGKQKTLARAVKVQKKAKNNVIALDSDNDVSDNDTRDRGQQTSVKGRVRRKSDSLTPPPQLSPRRRLAGTQIIKEAFRSRSNNVSSDLLTTTIPTDEAEVLFEEQMRQRALAESELKTNQSDMPTRSMSPLNTIKRTDFEVANNVPDSLVDIVIRGVHVEIPNSTSIIPDVAQWEIPKIIRIRLNTKLSIAKIGFCKEAGLSTIENGSKIITIEDQKKMDDIILTYRNIRIFDYVTPHSLGIVEGVQPYFEAFTKQGWQCLEQFPEMRKAQSLSAAAQKTTSKDVKSSASPANATNADQDGRPYTRLTLRASDGRELKIRTRPTTKIVSIISGFRKTHSVPETTKIELRFEGEVLEGTMADHDIEDQDIVDVKIY